MPAQLGANNPRITAARELLSRKGRREQNRFLIEGPTLLGEARHSGVTIETLFATRDAYERFEIARILEGHGTDVFILDERSAHKLSDVETPSGLVAVSPVRTAALEDLFKTPGLVLVLADLGDPGNAGTLVRSADAFGARGVVFSEGAVDPHNPKVVRAAMGSLFRQKIAVAGPSELAPAAQKAAWSIAGLDAGGVPIHEASRPSRLILVVGQERHGLGAWGAVCTSLLAIEMHGGAESLNAAVAGSIALYELARPGP
ncbi:MAG: RNA methyltransferase [Candidatus Eremiobacteraeota bacterium]|nr:RNA methyltransferase [Candidatus Eremiobacteraeota bacterium]